MKKEQIIYSNESFQVVDEFIEELNNTELEEDMSLAWEIAKMETAFKLYCATRMLNILQCNNPMKIHNGFKSYPKAFFWEFKKKINWRLYPYGFKLDEERMIEDFIFIYELTDMNVNEVRMNLSKENIEKTLIGIIEATKPNVFL